MDTRQREDALAEYGEYLLRSRIAGQKHARFYVRWVREYLKVEPQSNATPDETLTLFTDNLERDATPEWQIEQARRAISAFFSWQAMPRNPGPAPKVVPGPDGTVETAPTIAAMKETLRVRHYSYRTEQTYIEWARRFLAYLIETGSGVDGRPLVSADGIRAFISCLATRHGVSATTQNQALAALLFLCREVLGMDVGDIGRTVRARQGKRLPTVLSSEEVSRLFAGMSGTSRLMAELTYGAGLRVSECCRLRVQDIDMDGNTVRVRGGKGDKDRTTILPEKLKKRVREHLERVRKLFDQDRTAQVAGVHLPDALERKMPKAGTEWAWYWVFPSRNLSVDPRGGVVRRHHVSDAVLQKAVIGAARKADIPKPVSVHALRHSFATHLLLNNVDIRQVQELLGHSSVETTMVYTHVLKELRNAPKSPFDAL